MSVENALKGLGMMNDVFARRDTIKADKDKLALQLASEEKRAAERNATDVQQSKISVGPHYAALNYTKQKEAEQKAAGLAFAEAHKDDPEYQTAAGKATLAGLAAGTSNIQDTANMFANQDPEKTIFQIDQAAESAKPGSVEQAQLRAMSSKIKEAYGDWNMQKALIKRNALVAGGAKTTQLSVDTEPALISFQDGIENGFQPADSKKAQAFVDQMAIIGDDLDLTQGFSKQFIEAQSKGKGFNASTAIQAGIDYYTEMFMKTNQRLSRAPNSARDAATAFMNMLLVSGFKGLEEKGKDKRGKIVFSGKYKPINFTAHVDEILNSQDSAYQSPKEEAPVNKNSPWNAAKSKAGQRVYEKYGIK
jgi:hypothetical protein